MSTDRQIEANRLNAQHSTGPSTPEGRAAVRLNGLKYGLYAETLILPGEDPAEFDALVDRLDADHQPATPTEEIFVAQRDADCGSKSVLAGFKRYEARLDRSILSATQELRRCRADRRATESEAQGQDQT